MANMPVKYQGEIPLYVVKGIRPDYSLQGKGIIPNKKFIVRYGLMQFTDLQELVLDKLEGSSKKPVLSQCKAYS